MPAKLNKTDVEEWLLKKIPKLEELNIYSLDDLKDYINGRLRPPGIVEPPPNKLRVQHRGHSVKIPKPTIIIDSHEHMGYSFDRFPKWIEKTIRKPLRVGDYTIEGLEDEIVIERKTQEDLVNCVLQERYNFIRYCERLSKFPEKYIEIETSLTQLKTPYSWSMGHPNAVVGSLLAIQERWHIPIIFADHFILAEEWTASALSKFYTFHWLQKNGYGRYLRDGDI